MLRVMTFNVHHGADLRGRLNLERIARVISESGADLVGLQEVDRHFAGRSGFADQAGWLAERLAMRVGYAPCLDLDPPAPGRPRRQYGNALLSRYPVEEYHTTLLPRCGSREERGLLSARVSAPGRMLHVYTTHLHNASPHGRLVQARRVREEIGTPPRSVILFGDFNAAPGTAEVAELTSGLVDAWERAGSGPGYTFDARRPRVRIDYVLTSPDLTAVSATVVDTRASDHRPVLVELQTASGRGAATTAVNRRP